jgi:hypothetical protein
MFFVVDYDRKQGKIISLTSFSTNQREAAEDARLKIELQIDQAESNREIVLIEAKDEDNLRESHSRYFDDFEALVAAGTSALYRS